ncbi:MAG: T9SS type A sorting domain-containing protein [Bacteroidetes bacterium]|nr:T9SS type A sorting domain-containing protein [Bacteroidota bacterium]
MGNLRNQHSRVEVLDVAGRALYTTAASSMGVSIDLSAFPAGQYLVRVTTDSGIQTERIVRY